MRNLKRWFRMQAIRGGCVMCRHEPPDHRTQRDYAVQLRTLQAHHILPKRFLDGDPKWDPRNGLGLCQYHHMRHENWVQRIPRALLPPYVHDFASEQQMTFQLDQEYPDA